MRFPLKIAIAAVLAKGIVAELAQSSQAHSPNQVHSSSAQAAVKGIQSQKYVESNFPNQQEAFNQQPDQTNADEPQYYDESVEEQPSQQSYVNQMAYQGIQDPIQQYASQYGNGVEQADSTNEVPTVIDPNAFYPNQFSGNPIHGGYNPTGYNSAPYNPNQYNPGAFNVQTGFEGYLVPGPQLPPQKQVVAPRNPPSVINSLQAIPSGLIASMRDTTSLLSRSFAFVMTLLGVTIGGGAITTALCSFTPLCTISFALPFVRSGIRDITEPLLGKESAEILEKAMTKFGALNAEFKGKVATESESIAPKIETKSMPAVENGDAIAEKTRQIDTMAESEKNELPANKESNTK